MNARWRIRFSLRMLLIGAPLAAVVLAWIFSHVVRSEVAAYVRVHPNALLYCDPPANPRVRLMDATPDEILLDAVQTLSPSALARIDSSGDPIAWMRRNVQITMVRDKLLRIAIANHAPIETATTKEIVDALALSLSKAEPSDFHKLFVRYPGGIKVLSWGQVERDSF
jgi:hypothetical protein